MKENILKFKNIAIQNFTKEGFIYREWIVPYHLEIVERITMELCDIYQNANRDIVQVLVWFHDFGKPFNEENEKESTAVEGVLCLRECGFSEDFINAVVRYWELMEKKNEIDLSTTPIETQIISSADGASHLVGTFYAGYFGDGNDFITTQKRLREKIDVDWNRKITLPEVRVAFKDRYLKARELLGEFPESFIK